MKTKYNEGRYEFEIFRKPRIKNAQIKPYSQLPSSESVREFQRFPLRENRFDRETLWKIFDKFQKKTCSMNKNNNSNNKNNYNSGNKQTITLTWMPIIGTKLKKAIQKFWYRVTF